ncbi:MAG: ribosome recycling factor [Deltaproteobacteria bacterium CG11_big_fil_rev_8_21_14_0_20_47_16]|nr:MAG: ribosome recycling factor [Deltaproteobacteria bacterium CG11_big_fil_rev_8_21_14_0_20_47_16]
MDNILNDTKARMQKALQSLRDELTKTRTGRASLGILDGIKVDYYGTATPLNQVAALATPDARLITVQPWESNLIAEIEKAILKAGIGLNPVNDGKLIRLPIPALTEERRKELVKGLKKHGEECKVAMRNVRRDANEALKAADLTEDALKKAQNDVQKLTDDFTKQADDAVSHKEKELMTV